jgi:hypothetical protein
MAHHTESPSMFPDAEKGIRSLELRPDDIVTATPPLLLRKIRQIVVSDETEFENTAITALCEDSSIWFIVLDRHSHKWGQWRQIPSLPGTLAAMS